MNLPYDSVSELARDLRVAHFDYLHALPFNRFTESSIEASERWWLTPTTDKIAFPFGKITLSTRERWLKRRHPDKIFVGFNVEKGDCQSGIEGR